VILDAGSAGTARTILRKIGPWPLAIAAVALVGLGTYFVMNTPRQRAVAANRRRRMSRNGGYSALDLTFDDDQRKTVARLLRRMWASHAEPFLPVRGLATVTWNHERAAAGSKQARDIHRLLSTVPHEIEVVWYDDDDVSPDGKVVLKLSSGRRKRRMSRNSGDWIVPAGGSSRFKSRAEADKAAKFFRTHYGSGIFDAKVVKEPSKSRPGTYSYQVYIRPLHPALK
jgi:hypothetical protein